MFIMLLFTTEEYYYLKNMKKYFAASLLEEPSLRRKEIFSTREARQILGWPPKELSAILFRLVRKGKIARIKRGLFCFLPPGCQSPGGSYPQHWFLIAREIARPKPYFISHYSAMQLHGMTSEAIQTVFISLSEQRRPPRELRIPLRFVTIPKERFWGLEENWVTNEEKVWTSNLERTIIDALDRPDLTGGLLEIARGIWLVKTKLKTPKLIDYAVRFHSFAASKRLGFIIEKWGIGTSAEIQKLNKSVVKSTSYALLDPTRDLQGRYLSRWRLRLNLDPGELERNLMT
jgi:predicted transcriptional regulator of viral defense system